MTRLWETQVLKPDVIRALIAETVAAEMEGYTPPTPGPVAAATDLSRITVSQRRYHLTGLTVGEVSANQTWNTIRTLEGRFSWVRIGIAYDRRDDCTIAGVLLAPTASAADPLNPVDANGDPVDFIRGTFNNGGLPIPLADQLARQLFNVETPAYTIAAAKAPVNASQGGAPPWYKVENKTWTDWMLVPSLVRTDGGTFPLLIDRIKFTGTPSIGYGITAGFDAVAGGRFCRTYANAGDCITTPEAFTSTERVSELPTHVVEYMSDQGIIQVAHNGDSIQGPLLNHVTQAVLALSTAARPLEMYHGAKGGQSVVEYTDTMRQILPQIARGIHFLSPWSPNGTSSVALAEEAWARTMEAVDIIKKAGGVPVLMTPAPCPGRIDTVEEEAFRLLTVNRVLELGNRGYRILDQNEFYSSGGNPAGYKPGYTDDLVHPTQLAQSELSAARTCPLLQSILDA